jgi:hypothetical protein
VDEIVQQLCGTITALIGELDSMTADAISIGTTLTDARSAIGSVPNIRHRLKRQALRTAKRGAGNAADIAGFTDRIATKLTDVVATCPAPRRAALSVKSSSREGILSCADIADAIRAAQGLIADLKSGLDEIDRLIRDIRLHIERIKQTKSDAWPLAQENIQRSLDRALDSLGHALLTRSQVHNEIRDIEDDLAKLIDKLAKCATGMTATPSPSPSPSTSPKPSPTPSARPGFGVNLNGSWHHNGPGDSTLFACASTDPAQPSASYVYTVTKPDSSKVQEQGTLDSFGEAEFDTAITQFGSYTQAIVVTSPEGTVEQSITTNVTSKQKEDCAA